MSSIAVIDYGMGNLRSVAKALERMAPKANVRITQTPKDIITADRIVFPGQGAMGGCMHELHRLNLVDTVREAAINKPFLGLCLGPQALFDYSEENGGTQGLGILKGRVLRFREDLHDSSSAERLKIPHMGWNQVYHTQPHPLWQDITQNSRYYFVHSYYLQPDSENIVAGRTCYGIEFASAVALDNIFAVQFHPEKSARAGLQLLANFARWNPT